jgi:hypothetical protein
MEIPDSIRTNLGTVAARLNHGDLGTVVGRLNSGELGQMRARERVMEPHAGVQDGGARESSGRRRAGAKGSRT